MTASQDYQDLQLLAQRLGERLRARRQALATAESCTGGWLAKVLTDIAGSSAWFDRGYITYSNESKIDLLGVRPETLEANGAVSEPTVREMAAGALARSRADIVVAITGVAGPSGGSAEKPVGTVWLAWAGAGRPLRSRQFAFTGEREEVRYQAVLVALRGLLDIVADE